jgi:hypothetical protein
MGSKTTYHFRDPEEIAKKPDDPVWQSIAGKNLDSILGKDLQSDVRVDPRVSNYLAKQAFATGPSAWRDLAGQQQALRYSGLQDQLAQQGATAQAQAMNQLAMRGGLRGGSAERLAQQGAQNRLLAGQGAARANMESLMGLDLADEQRKQQALGALGQRDLATAEFQRQQEQFNLMAAMQEMAAKRGFDLSQWEKQMEAWGAEQTARSMQK